MENNIRSTRPVLAVIDWDLRQGSGQPVEQR